MNSFPAQRLPDLWHHGGGADRGSGGRKGVLVRESGHNFRLCRLHRTHDVQCQNRTVGIVIQDISLKTLPFTNRSVSNPGSFLPPIFAKLKKFSDTQGFITKKSECISVGCYVVLELKQQTRQKNPGPGLILLHHAA